MAKSLQWKHENHAQWSPRNQPTNPSIFTPTTAQQIPRAAILQRITHPLPIAIIASPPLTPALWSRPCVHCCSRTYSSMEGCLTKSSSIGTSVLCWWQRAAIARDGCRCPKNQVGSLATGRLSSSIKSSGFCCPTAAMAPLADVDRP